MANLNPEAGVGIDALFQGKAYGSVAEVLLANEMNPDALRVNSTLRHEEWQEIDETVQKIASIRLGNITELVSRGLVYNITDGLGTMVLAFEDESDMSAATVDMDGLTPGTKDRAKYGIKYLPLPIIHKEFGISARVLNASRRMGMPLDTTQAAIATRKVSEMAEQILFRGYSSYTFGGGTIRGLCDFDYRNTGTITTAWDTSGVTGATILGQVLDMKQACLDAKHYGPYGLWVPKNFETTLDDDFKANGTDSIRERILGVNNIEFVRVSDSLADDNVVLCELTPETIRMVVGMQPVPVQWESRGGLGVNFLVMAILVPQIRADQDNNCGVAHWSV